ncbi:MAG: zinc ABC transporter substrate-binding protein [Desulfovibrio sp.]|nr:zinc ABC transporter substrate-binding protein [Desulfovibrio sp.]MCA1984938.1 zinc ABC transporter substrate-binding protein [Desulfovibrio sp.]
MRRVVAAMYCLVLLALPVAGQAAMRVGVTVAPQIQFVERIAGPLVEVEALVAPGKDPHNYEPTPRQMQRLAESSLYFAIGMPWEARWLPKIAGATPSLEIVHLDEGLEKIALPEHGCGHDHDHAQEHAPKSEHEHGHEHPAQAPHAGHHHESGELDPHLWTSPRLVMQMAKTMAAALARKDPANAATYQANLDAFLKDVQALDDELTQLFAGKGGRFMVYHPAWGYFARDYGLTQVSIELDGKEPSARELKNIIDEAKHAKVQLIFVQPQFSMKAAQTIARDIGAQVVPADPLAQDWLANMRAVANAFKTALH